MREALIHTNNDNIDGFGTKVIEENLFVKIAFNNEMLLSIH